MSCFDKVAIELQWIASYLWWVATFHTIHATCALTFMVYKYSELQMPSTIQKFNYKASCKTPFFFIMSTTSTHKLIQIYLHFFPCNKHTIHVRHMSITNLMDMEHPNLFPYINEWSERFHILHHSFKTNCIFMFAWSRLKILYFWVAILLWFVILKKP